LENCCFINIGKYALYLSGGRNNSICGNDISFGAEGGIFAIGSPGNKISDNHIHHCGQVRKHIGGIVLYGADSSGNVVSHNLIHDISRYGITLKDPGCRNIIEYNHVFNTNLETFDTGAIEVTQQDKEFRSRGIIKYNLLHDNVGYSSDRGIDLFGAWGIYLDSYAGGYTVSHNITYKNSSGGIMLQGGKDNNVFNNIIVGDGYQAIVVKNFADNSTGLRFERNIVCLREGNLFGCGNISRKMLRCDKNLYFHLHHKPMNIFWWSRWQSGEWWTVNLEAWEKSGFDENSIVDDPLFAGQKKDNFRLKAGSPAFRLGFEPIDVKKMGLITKRKGRPSRPVFSDFDICARRCSDCKKHKVNLSPCRHMKPVIFSKK
jgi:parallel beta-helix repeat protein